MRFFSKVMFPDGSAISEGWVDLPSEHLPAVGAEASALCRYSRLRACP